MWDFRTTDQLHSRTTEDDDAESETTDVEDQIDRNAQLALNPTMSQVGRTSIVEAAKPKGEGLRVLIEFLIVLGEILIKIAVLKAGPHKHHQNVAAIANMTAWGYICLLVVIRAFLTSSKRLSFPVLWSHTAFLYGTQWLLTLFVFRSHLTHARSETLTALVISDFVLVSLLLSMVLASRVGNKAVEVEYEDNIPPARESTATLFSLATFTWVDGIVWTGYKKTLEMPQVWNLEAKDKAAYVVAQYRQARKTHALAWHLLRHFKVQIMQQAAWAGFSGVLTFVPTLIVKAILQYVENPASSSRSAAWFYVSMLFVSGCVAAISDAQSFYIGRRICIRLRAIIVGELYTKALKRKAGTVSGKALGEKKRQEESQNSLWAKIKRFARKEKYQKIQDQDESDNKKDSQITSGAIINLMAVDSFKVSEVSAYLHFLWATTPVQFVLTVVLLYYILGFSSIAGIGMMFLLMPVHMVISHRFSAAQKSILAATDARINITNEVLSNIRIIKYFAWEQRFMHSINEKRNLELASLRVRYVLWATAFTVWGGAPILITFLSFAVYTLVEQKDLTPSVAFTAMSLFAILRQPLDQLADMVAHVQEAKVSVDRIEEFLNQEDTQRHRQLRHPERADTDPIIGFNDGTFAWGSYSSSQQDVLSSFRLMDLNLRFAIGKFNVIAGPTGCGKTSLLMALLGEMTLLKGQVYLPCLSSREDLTPDRRTGLTEGVAFCAQQAWLVNDSVKQNIIFASPWNAKRYKDVVNACALEKDFEILDSGDQTLVGEKGVTLSGGQKQRISLARALYSNARHVLLDDVLSAVDSHTQKWIFDQALMGPLMKNRTCILVTHNVSLCIPRADYAVLLDNGRVVSSGTAEDIISGGKLVSDITSSTPASKGPSPSASDTNLEQVRSNDSTAQHDTNFDANGHANPNKVADRHENLAAGPAKATQTPSNNAMDESKAEGSVKLSIITMYFRSMGAWPFWIIATFLFTAQQFANVSTNIWIRQWANAYTVEEESLPSQASTASLNYFRVPGWRPTLMPNSWVWNLQRVKTSDEPTMSTTSQVDSTYYLEVYAAIGIVFLSLTFLREGILYAGSLTASKKIHQRLMECVCHAKFRFFDSTPLGQIMNRFSKDIEAIDQEIAPVALGVAHCLMSCFTVVILISAVVPGFLVPASIITVFFVLLGRIYIRSSRDLKRLESVQRSPIYQQFGETLSGMITIRAYGDERRFIRENLNKINVHNRPFIYLWATTRWLSIRVDALGSLVSLFTGVFVVLSVGKVDAGAAGLALTYASTFTDNVLWFVRLYAQNEQNMNSVERIKEYLDVDQEAAPIKPDNRPPADWPQKGSIEYVDYTTRYRKDFDPVLRNLNLKIASCEKVGIVGRTGAGKSSLALSLFRALEAEKGKILIDDVEIGEIGLQDLRESIVMVPQDPTLFSGTIRSNLDPFNLFSDEEIFTALRRVQLIGTTLSSVPSNPVESSNYSDHSRDSHSTGTTTAVGTPRSENDLPNTSSRPYTSENKNIFLTLSSSISESGSNLSQGQRQLLCLARALLKSPKVLIMDEATASIDYATDAKIQETIRELKGNTIVTIAHRLKTIVDYDRVVVMERGEVVEVGVPWELLRPDEAKKAMKSERGTWAKTLDVERKGEKRWFKEMCEMSGELEVLEREAKRVWEGKRLVDVS